MNVISRRGFLGQGAAALGAAYLTQGAGPLAALPLGLPIGCQTWPVRESIGKDLDGTLRELKSSGFQAIELCSPPGYEKTGFGPLIPMKASELRDHIQSAGIKCESCHYVFSELKNHLDERAAFAKGLGLRQMIISTFALPKTAAMADWMKAADEANKLGERTKAAGIQLGFHNHDFEFQKIGNDLIYDRLMGELDPQLVKMQFQVGVARLGYNAADFFEKYPGRFISMHLQDWSPAENKEVALGKGMVDWKRTFAAAKKGGIRNYFVEMDLPVMKESVPYLQKLKV